MINMIMVRSNWFDQDSAFITNLKSVLDNTQDITKVGQFGCVRASDLHSVYAPRCSTEGSTNCKEATIFKDTFKKVREWKDSRVQIQLQQYSKVIVQVVRALVNVFSYFSCCCRWTYQQLGKNCSQNTLAHACTNCREAVLLATQTKSLLNEPRLCTAIMQDWMNRIVFSVGKCL